MCHLKTNRIASLKLLNHKKARKETHKNKNCVANGRLTTKQSKYHEKLADSIDMPDCSVVHRVHVHVRRRKHFYWRQ
jgi:hypothetical protein